MAKGKEDVFFLLNNPVEREGVQDKIQNVNITTGHDLDDLDSLVI